MPSSFEVPHYSYENLKNRASDFLQSYHPKGSIPVPIEEIIEFKFEMNIIPIPGLHQGFDIDGFTSSDLTEIRVDQDVYESRPGRYRFTLAHELGHVILHRQVYRKAAFSKMIEWQSFVNEISVKEYEWLEWQANTFAGLILVPPDLLRKKLAEAARSSSAAGLPASKFGDVAKQYVASYLAKVFDVSMQVVERRLTKDNLWPPPPR